MSRRAAMMGQGKGHNLPNIYQEVEYLESNRTAFINTGYTPIYGDIFYCGYVYLDHDSNFGVPFSAFDNLSCRILILVNNDNTISYVYSNSGYKTFSLEIDVYSKFDIILKNNGLIINNFSNSFTSSSKVFTNPLYIQYYQGNQKIDYGRIYYLKIMDNTNEIIKHNYIPCYRRSDSKPGMYDIVSNTFFVNQGTGADFICGPTVY